MLFSTDVCGMGVHVPGLAVGVSIGWLQLMIVNVHVQVYSQVSAHLDGSSFKHQEGLAGTPIKVPFSSHWLKTSAL